MKHKNFAQNKKAQVKVFENIGVLLMFFVLVVIAIVFFYVFQRGELEQDRIQIGAQSAVQLATQVALLPELQCRNNNAQEDHCIDKLKIISLGTILLNEDSKQSYFNIFGYSTIRIRSLYPSSFVATVYNNELASFSQNDTFFIPISIFDPVSTKYNYGVLEVSAYR